MLLLPLVCEGLWWLELFCCCCWGDRIAPPALLLLLLLLLFRNGEIAPGAVPFCRRDP